MTEIEKRLLVLLVQIYRDREEIEPLFSDYIDDYDVWINKILSLVLEDAGILASDEERSMILSEF